MDLYTIRDLVRAQQIKFTKHAPEERRHAQLSEAEVRDLRPSWSSRSDKVGIRK